MPTLCDVSESRSLKNGPSALKVSKCSCVKSLWYAATTPAAAAVDPIRRRFCRAEGQVTHTREDCVYSYTQLHTHRICSKLATNRAVYPRHKSGVCRAAPQVLQRLVIEGASPLNKRRGAWSLRSLRRVSQGGLIGMHTLRDALKAVVYSQTSTVKALKPGT